MNAEVKEVVVTLLQGRRYLFDLFHTLLGEQPTVEIAAVASSENSLRALSLFTEDDCPAAGNLIQLLARLQSCDLDGLREEYTRLFLGPQDLIAPPWESVYLSAERAIFQKSTLAVHMWYEQFGYVPKSYPHEPDDHISLMMHFLALLCQRALDALEADNMVRYRDALAAQMMFEQNHLLNWLGAYATEMEKSETHCFYPQLVDTMQKLVQYDNALLMEIMGSESL